MKIINRIIRVSALFAVLTSPAVSEPDPDFHIYLMVGQSNMEGAATIEEQDRVTNPRVMVLQDEDCPRLGAAYGQWRIAAPPLIRCLSYLGLGPGDTFGKVMAENSGAEVTVGLVGAAHGGQKIEYFLKDCDSYNACTPTYGSTPNNFHGGYEWLLDLARRAQQRGVIKGIIFHQGESNTGDTAWPGRVKQLVTDVRNDLGTGDIPFIAGELPYSGCCASHNTLVRQLPSVISNAHVVTAEGLGVHDAYHWDSAGVREMGRRYANKMLGLVDTSSSDSNEDDGEPIDEADDPVEEVDNTILVRLRGIVGDEAVNLQVGGVTVRAWTASTEMTDYTVQTNASGEIRVAFTNDNGGRDVQVDYIIVNGVVRQAEDQEDNTGVWGNSTCGGGSYSEWLHCNGSIGFDTVNTYDVNTSQDIVDEVQVDSGSAGISAAIEISNDWNAGYCATLVITNDSGSAATWQVEIPIEGRVNALWNGEWSQTESILNVSGIESNAILQSGQTDRSIGFCAIRDSGN
ncbi:MAG: sialate O-acetylesterase [Chromatiales bacterium]|jgi:hypothetical protein